MKRQKMNIALTLSVIFALMLLVIIYTTRLFYRISVANITEVGEDKVAAMAVQMENYLDTAKTVLWVTADTVDSMIRQGDSNARILDYLVEESKNQEQQFDENYTGIYGYINGEYLDGVGWVPPEDYEPTERDWYLAARKAAGASTIVSPYVDAQTGAVIISISRLLSDGESALSLDVMMNEIQRQIESVKIKDKGFGFLINEDGMIVSHGRQELKGKPYREAGLAEGFLEELFSLKNGSFKTKINGEISTVFVARVLEQWYVVIAVRDAELYGDVWAQLIVNILVYLISFSVISVVCVLAYQNEWKYSRRVEELKINEQKQEYEAKVLRLEKSAADAANKAKGDFLAEMSHEIRTPINAVLGMNEMILRESHEKEIRQYAGNIQTAGKTLLSIINDILDFTKIEDGKLEIQNVKYDLAGLLHNLVTSIRERANAKKLEFVVEVDESLPSVLLGDDVRITQVILNLLTNAVKYTDKGTVTFKVKNGGVSGDHVLLDVSVRDTGIGIKEEDRAKLFESFERLEEKRNRHIEGTGLGMAIVVKLLGMMGSEIELESEYGKGSEFSFQLRQKIIDAQPIGDYEERIRNREQKKRDQAYLYAPKAAVLVVDDNEMNLAVVRNLMKRSGIVPDTASSGMQAIEMIARKRYDVVLLDHMMPKMDGIETLERLSEEGLLQKGVVVVALTANAVVGAREKYLSAGFDDYLSKPIDITELEAILSKYLPPRIISYRKDAANAPMELRAGREDEPLEFEADTADEPMEFEAGQEDGPMEFEPMGKKRTKDSLQLESSLKAVGLNTAKGLLYCGGDWSFYGGMLKDFVANHEQKRGDLDAFYREKNWKEYQVAVHALKSNSKTIGALELSEKARLLETAAGERDTAYLEKEHGEFMAAYDELCGKLQEITG